METTGKELADSERPLYWPRATAYAQPTTEEIAMGEIGMGVPQDAKKQALLACLRSLGILDADKQPGDACEKGDDPSNGKLAENAAKRLGNGAPVGGGEDRREQTEPLALLTRRQNELISKALCLRAVEVTPDLAPKVLKALRCALVEELTEVTRQTAVPPYEVRFLSAVG